MDTGIKEGLGEVICTEYGLWTGGSSRELVTDTYLEGRTDRLCYPLGVGAEGGGWQERYTAFWLEYLGVLNKTHFPMCREALEASFG